MQRPVRLLGAFSLLCLSVLGQEPPPPASQLAKLEPFVGNWGLSGTMRETPDGEELPWTATHSARWVLGGHFLREELIITTGPGMPQIAFTSFSGWDNENGKYMSYGANNMGQVDAIEVHFIDDHTTVTARTAIMLGQVMMERGIVRIEEDSYSLEVQSSTGDGPFFTHVMGTATRTSAEGEAQAVEATMSFAPAAPEMALLEKMTGEYEVVGSVVPAPGVPEMAITGTETYSLILGGTVLQQHLIGGAVGEDATYEAIGYMAWDPANNCYSTISVDNMGMAGKVQMRKLGDRMLVATMAAQMYGEPTLSRTTLNLDAQGHISTVFSDMIIGASETKRTFSGTYTKR